MLVFFAMHAGKEVTQIPLIIVGHFLLIILDNL